jgi:Methyltransferase small domain.
MVQLYGDERLDHLLAENLRIIQSPTVFAFSMDSVFLARFAYLPIQKGKILDLGTGNGVIPLILSKRTKARITGVEIQPRLYDMAQRSVEYNGLQEQIRIIRGDLKQMPEILGYGTFDVVLSNPPYFPVKKGAILNEREHYAIARHELACTLEDVVESAAKLVKPGGKVAFVHRPGRLAEIIYLMKQCQIEPKRLRLVYPKMGREANTLLIEGMKGANPDLKILPPLYVYQENGEYTPEARSLLFGE